MKKIICILLSVIMLLSLMPLTALADEVSFSYDEINDVLADELDYSAYDGIVAMVNAMDRTPYIEDSLEALDSSIISRDSLMYQNDIDAAVAKIAEAYSSLVKKSVEVKFFVINSEGIFTRQDYVFSYGDTAKFVVKDTDEKVYKWMKSVNDADINLCTQVEELSIVVTEDMELIAYTDIAPEIKEQSKQVKFVGANGRTVSIAYTLDVDNMEMPEAPAVPFYDFVGWVKVDDTTYQAQYSMNIACEDNQHVYKAIVVAPTCTGPGYVIFECPCGEVFTTDYTKPIGHNYDGDTGFCLNGCGTQEAGFEEEEIIVPESTETTEPAQPSNPKVDENGVDEGGYNTYVLLP